MSSYDKAYGDIVEKALEILSELNGIKKASAPLTSFNGNDKKIIDETIRYITMLNKNLNQIASIEKTSFDDLFDDKEIFEVAFQSYLCELDRSYTVLEVNACRAKQFLDDKFAV